MAPGGGEPLLSEAVRWGDLVFLSGRGAVDAARLVVESHDFEAQARSTCDQIVAALAAAGSAPEHVLRVECYLADPTHFDAWNRIYAGYFPAPRPVRTTIVTSFVVPGMLIEVQVTAGVPSSTVSPSRS